ncbi:PREDICTED: uncharacterized protein LOC109114491 [Nelumbo nucifera]|uniref:Uncharacterized protein LOC109114491 n=1 Tax=Nelumbo nucifera TaxID=4432 RepID=A0A1U8Q1N5_NELNU|nr:PREDICTED: uncharacterized protein LOC109114491 [Nelumbo nucifera]
MSAADPSLIIYHKGFVILYMLVYVDDILLTSSSSSSLDDIVATLGRTFSLKDLGSGRYFLGIEIMPQPHGIVLTQQRYILHLFNHTNLAEVKPLTSSMEANIKLFKFSGDSLSDPFEYRNIVGTLQYVTITRFDIPFSVNKACQFLHSPTIKPCAAVKRILRYLKQIVDHGLYFYSTPALLTLRAFSNADWASYPNDKQAIGGYLIYLGCNVVAWSSKKQPTIA